MMQTEQKDKYKENNVSLRDVLFVLKKNLILFLAVIIFVVACGVVYSYVRDYEYTAKEQAIYTAQNNIDSTTTNNINGMRAYVDTVMDFCKQGVVLDRASYYYDEYTKNPSKYSTVDKYIEAVELNDTYDGKAISKTFFIDKNVEISSSGEEEMGFTFYVSYTDETPSLAKEKVKILVLAFNKEIKATTFNGETYETKYFDNITVNIKDMGTVSVVADMSRTTILVVFVALGVVFAAVTIYLKSMLDNTVKDKADLERIAECSVLSTIEIIGGDN